MTEVKQFLSFNPGITVAMAIRQMILNAIETDIGNSLGEEITASYVTSYSNVREQGLTLVFHLKDQSVAHYFRIAEFRRSDHTVVYHGTGFDYFENLSDAEYENKKLFEKPYGAALFIIRTLNEAVKESNDG